MNIEVFKCKIVNSTYHTRNGATIVFGPTQRDASIGYYATSDIDEIAELNSMIKSFGKGGGHIYQDNLPVDFVGVDDGVSFTEQQRQVQQRMQEIDQGKLDALKLLLEAQEKEKENGGKTIQITDNPNPDADPEIQGLQSGQTAEETKSSLM